MAECYCFDVHLKSVKDIFFLLLTSSPNDQKSVLSFAKRQIKQKIFSKIALKDEEEGDGVFFSFILNNVNADPL